MKSYNFYRRAALILPAFVFFVFPNVNSAQPKPAAETKNVWELTYLKAKPNQFERLVSFVEKNWFAPDRIAVEQNLIKSYRLIKNKNAENPEWDAVVAVEYLNPLGYEGIKNDFEKIRVRHQTILIDNFKLSDLGSIVKSEKMTVFSEDKLWGNAANDPNGYAREIAAWRKERAADLQSEDGWLSLAGLFWLKTGANSVGAGDEYDVALPMDKTPIAVGVINFNGKTARLELREKVAALADGKPVTGGVELNSDDGQKPTIVQIGRVKFNLIKRGERFGIRVKDSQRKARLEFTGLHWFPVDESYKITARFEPYPQPKEIRVPNVLGGDFPMKSPGLLIFEMNGKQYRLEPVAEEDGKLFIIFRDLTSQTETYQAGRFLYAEKPINGTVILDFNRAVNPPCAFTAYATCPLPPAQNRLAVEIPAGEKRFH